MILFPLKKKYNISQNFGEYFGGYYKRRGLKGHNGTDFSTPTNTPIIATHDGICYIGNSKTGYGKYIKLKSDSRESIYAHLNKFKVKNGQMVRQGDIIGYTGNSGGSTGPHLHFGFRSLENGKVMNYNNGFHGYWDVIGKGNTFLAEVVKYV